MIEAPKPSADFGAVAKTLLALRKRANELNMLQRVGARDLIACRGRDLRALTLDECRELCNQLADTIDIARGGQ